MGNPQKKPDLRVLGSRTESPIPDCGSIRRNRTRAKVAGFPSYTETVVRDRESVTRDALALPDDTRAALAAALLESLEPAVDEDIENEWLSKVQRRAAELDGGQVQGIPWSAVDQKLRAALNRAS